ncbi:MAG: permease [Elusimicrobia bacterium]|nr:permease [Elusimicrobiota bacterium]
MSGIDKTDPICGMEGTIQAHGHYFCSGACIKKYEQKNNITQEKCPGCVVKQKKWYRENLFLVVLGLACVHVINFVFSLYGITVLDGLIFSFHDYIKRIWLAVILGLFIGGIIDYFIPREYITKYLSRNKKSTVFYSVGFGFLMSVCSHGILAISIELYKKGASTSSVIAFLLASPWANFPVTILLFSFFGIKALFFIISAIVIAIITGLIYQVLEKKGMVESNKNVFQPEQDFSIIKDIKTRMKGTRINPESLKITLMGIMNGSWSLAKMVLWWILIGMFLASATATYIPKDFFIHYMGSGLSGLLVTLALATVIEICSEGSAPLAFEIFRQTGAFGNSFVFLMAGVSTDYTEIGLLWSNIGRKTALWLPVITVPQVLILGYLFNTLL